LLGQTQLNAGNYNEAERNLVASFHGLKESLEIKSEAIQKTLASLIELYNKLNKKDKVDYYSNLINESID
jgi:hypothetical protein